MAYGTGSYQRIIPVPSTTSSTRSWAKEDVDKYMSSRKIKLKNPFKGHDIRNEPTPMTAYCRIVVKGKPWGMRRFLVTLCSHRRIVPTLVEEPADHGREPVPSSSVSTTESDTTPSQTTTQHDQSHIPNMDDEPWSPLRPQRLNFDDVSEDSVVFTNATMNVVDVDAWHADDNPNNAPHVVHDSDSESIQLEEYDSDVTLILGEA